MFVPQNFVWALLLFSLGTIVIPRRKWKQCLCNILDDKSRVLWYFWKWPIGSDTIQNHWSFSISRFNRIMEINWKITLSLCFEISSEPQAPMISDCHFLIPAKCSTFGGKMAKHYLINWNIFTQRYSELTIINGHLATSLNFSFCFDQDEIFSSHTLCWGQRYYRLAGAMISLFPWEWPKKVTFFHTVNVSPALLTLAFLIIADFFSFFLLPVFNVSKELSLIPL